MDKTYHINGTEFYNPPIEYLSKETYPNFQLKLEEFKLLLKKQVENGEENHISSLAMVTTFLKKT